MKNCSVIMIGGSHGGYLAHLAAKFAPWLVDGVIDNSCGAKILPRLIGFGKEIDFINEAEFATFNFFNQIKTHCSTKTFWTTNKFSKNYFSKARLMIRTLLEKEHLKEWAKFNKTHFISYHSLKDEYVGLKDKQEFYEILKNSGFKTHLNAIKDESQIDGKFIKNLNHALGIPIKLLIKKELPKMLDELKTSPKKEYKNKSISYKCDDLLYTFSQKYNKLNLKITKENND